MLTQTLPPSIDAKPAVRTLTTELQDIVLHLTWGRISREYFNRSSSWIYNKLQGRDGNGGAGGFNPEEQQKLKGALCDLADRLRAAAERI